MNENIKTKKDKVVTWIKDNKGKLIAGGVMIGLTAFGIYKIKHMELVSEGGKVLTDTVEETIPIPEKLKELGVDYIDRYPECYEFTTGYADPSGSYPMKLSDMPTLVEGIKELSGTTDESDIWLMVSVGSKSGN